MAIIHCVERHEIINPSEIHRRKAVWESWEKLYKLGVKQCHLWDYPRTSATFGDDRNLPFLKDVFEAALKMAKKSDTILWTNDDIAIHKLAAYAVSVQVGVFDVASAHRCEIVKGQPIDMTCSPHDFAVRRAEHGGRDAFMASYSWFRKNLDAIPDFILGSSEFDYCLAAMIRHQKGFPIGWRTMHRKFSPCEMDFGYFIHEMHTPVWITRGNDKAQQHNRRLMYSWSRSLSLPLKFGHNLELID